MKESLSSNLKTKEDDTQKVNSQEIDDNEIAVQGIKKRLLSRTIVAMALVLVAVLLLAPRGLSFVFYATCFVVGLYTIYGIWHGMKWARATSIIFSVFLILSIGPFFIFIVLGIWNLIAIIITWWELDRALPSDTPFSLFPELGKERNSNSIT